MAGAVRLRGHVQSPRPLIKRRTNRFEPQRNGFLVDHPTTLSGSWRGENHPTPRGSYRRAYFWASPWYHKQPPTFADTLAAVRREIWKAQGLSISRKIPDVQKLPQRLRDGITHALCYAA